MGNSLGYFFTGEEDGELLAAVTEGLAPSPDSLELGRHHLQDLVPHFMTIGVIEPLEMIYVHHGDNILSPQAHQLLVEGTTRLQTSQVVTECHVVGILKYTYSKNQSRRRDKGERRVRRPAPS